MKPLLLTLLAVSFALSAFAQTQRIAHKSHSGTAANFSPKADEPGFGIIPSMHIFSHYDIEADTVALDSLLRTDHGKFLLDLLKECHFIHCVRQLHDLDQIRMVSTRSALDSLKHASPQPIGRTLYDGLFLLETDYPALRQFILSRSEKNLGQGYHAPTSHPLEQIPLWAGAMGLAAVGLFWASRSAKG